MMMMICDVMCDAISHIHAHVLSNLAAAYEHARVDAGPELLVRHAGDAHVAEAAVAHGPEHTRHVAWWTN